MSLVPNEIDFLTHCIYEWLYNEERRDKANTGIPPEIIDEWAKHRHESIKYLIDKLHNMKEALEAA